MDGNILDEIVDWLMADVLVSADKWCLETLL
jgi:hypothetical protein